MRLIYWSWHPILKATGLVQVVSGVGVGGQRQKGTDGLLEAEKPPDSKDVTCWSLWFTNFRKDQNHLRGGGDEFKEQTSGATPDIYLTVQVWQRIQELKNLNSSE